MSRTRLLQVTHNLQRSLLSKPLHLSTLRREFYERDWLLCMSCEARERFGNVCSKLFLLQYRA